MKKFKVIATETTNYEVEVEAKDFDDACANWHSKSDFDSMKVIDREWTTDNVEDKNKDKNLDNDNLKADIHHFTKIDKMGFDDFIVVYVLKAEYPNGRQYAIGVYSRGDYEKMNAQAKRHTERTGHRTWDLESNIQINRTDRPTYFR